jgi:hypothetical protein
MESSTYVNRPEARSVTGSHILVQSIDSIGPGHLTVLLVHIVCAGAGIVTDPDTKVLDLVRTLLVNLDKSVYVQRGGFAQMVVIYARVRTWFKETISPFAFFILRSLPRKYQNRDLATTSLGAKMRIR